MILVSGPNGGWWIVNGPWRLPIQTPSDAEKWQAAGVKYVGEWPQELLNQIPISTNAVPPP